MTSSLVHALSLPANFYNFFHLLLKDPPTLSQVLLGFPFFVSDSAKNQSNHIESLPIAF